MHHDTSGSCWKPQERPTICSSFPKRLESRNAPPRPKSEPSDPAIDPLANLVNARVVLARAMAVDGSWLWLHDQQDQLRRAWTPPSIDYHRATGVIEVYLNPDGEINGWRSPTARLAINQRALDTSEDPPSEGRDLVCQDACGITWVAPAALQVAARGEGCLTCGGTLALVP